MGQLRPYNEHRIPNTDKNNDYCLLNFINFRAFLYYQHVKNNTTATKICDENADCINEDKVCDFWGFVGR